jgi:hypothetical protein
MTRESEESAVDCETLVFGTDAYRRAVERLFQEGGPVIASEDHRLPISAGGALLAAPAAADDFLRDLIHRYFRLEEIIAAVSRGDEYAFYEFEANLTSITVRLAPVAAAFRGRVPVCKGHGSDPAFIERLRNWATGDLMLLIVTGASGTEYRLGIDEAVLAGDVEAFECSDVWEFAGGINVRRKFRRRDSPDLHQLLATFQHDFDGFIRPARRWEEFDP